MAAVGRCINAVVVASILLRPALALVVPAACPVLPLGSFPAAVELRAMSCIDPGAITGPINRIGNLVMSDLTGISSKGVQVSSLDGELKAILPPGQGTLTAGPSTCELVAVGFSKTSGSADASVQLRLDFDKCNGGGPATTIVLMDVVKEQDFMVPATVFPFFKEVFGVKTTTPALSLAKVKLGFLEQMVGNNTCDGPALRSYENVDDHACKMLCISDVSRFSENPTALINNVEVCRGYSFNANAGASGKICQLYKGVGVSKVSDPAGQAGFFCKNLTATVSSYDESTPAPPSAAEVLDADASLPTLKLSVLPKVQSASVSTYVSPNNTCFAPFSVVTLQDLEQATLSIGVKASEWSELLDMIPAPKARRLEESVGVAVSQVYVDRAVYGIAGAVPLAVVSTGPIGTTAAPACTPVAASSANGPLVFIVNLVLGVGCILTMVIGAFGCMAAHGKIKALAAAQGKLPPPAE